MQKEKLQADFNIPKFFTLIFFAIASLFYLGGCIAAYIPTTEHGYSHMKEVNEDMAKQLEPGITTKNDVRLLIGEPTVEDDRFFTYWWKRKDGYWFIAGGAELDAGSTKDVHAFCLEFRANGKLKRFKHFEIDWRNNEYFSIQEMNKQLRDWKDDEN
jgi:outer membrane protein assembly factor BamE (lipoprotein component of BamABCDE complex)